MSVTETETTTSAPVAIQTATKAGWAASGIHQITCPSGTSVKMRFPNLAQLVKMDLVPAELLQIALRELVQPGAGLQAIMGEPDEDGNAVASNAVELVANVKKAVSLDEWLVTQALVAPKITVDDLPNLPAEDVELIRQIATRERDTDALGVTLGVEPLSRWETFREQHGCAAGCEACQVTRQLLSTARLGSV